MSEAVHNAQQEFWRPAMINSAETPVTAIAAPVMAEVCLNCQSEFMIGARFCHVCGAHRPTNETAEISTTRTRAHEFLDKSVRWVQAAGRALWSRRSAALVWARYLHFHEIKRWVGLPTASLIALIVGLGCLLGALGVSLFYRASNLAEFQAIQMWRIEWLLGATASFVAGILLKKPSGD